MDLKVRASSEAEAERAEAAVLGEIDRENQILSGWAPESEFSRWAKTHGTAERVSPELFEALRQFDEWRERTGGAVDASAETAVRVWKAAAAENRRPTEAELSEAVREMQRPHWRLDPVARTATHLDDAPIALNSFAKSSIEGRAADKGLAAGASGIVVNVGGDIVLRGAITDEVAIADPKADAENDPAMDMVQLRDRTIATSGSYRRGVEIGGEHFSHIIDPRTGEATGEGKEAVISSTVIARDPSEAGALATALSVMTPEESGRLAAALGGVEYELVLRNGQSLTSAGWPRVEAPHLVRASYSPGQAGRAQAQLDLLVTLTVARIDDFRSRRPYVAVWVEDAQGKPVRSLALWSEKPRYLNELREWNRSHPTRDMMDGGMLTPSVSSATRPPGKYTLRWDGRDDNGSLLKPGKYTVFVEAVREHGTYQLQKQEINLDNKTPAQFDLPAGTEIAGVQMDYGSHGQ